MKNSHSRIDHTTPSLSRQEEGDVIRSPVIFALLPLDRRCRRRRPREILSGAPWCVEGNGLYRVDFVRWGGGAVPVLLLLLLLCSTACTAEERIFFCRVRTKNRKNLIGSLRGRDPGGHHHT